MIWLIPLLFAAGAAGLAYVAVGAFYAGAAEYSREYSSDTARGFEDVFLFIPPRRIEEAGWALGAAAFAVVFLALGSLTSLKGFASGLLLGGIAAAVALHVPGWILKALKTRRLERFNSQLVDTLIAMSNSLKAGFSITQAIETVVKDGERPISQEFDLFLKQTKVGVSFSEALENLERRVGSEDLTLMIAAVETARKTGGNLTEIFEKIAATIRERMRIENRVRTLTAQGRLQGIVVGLMPPAIAVVLVLLDPQMMMPFLRSGPGLLVIAAVAILLALGMLVIRRIVAIDI